MLTRAQKAAQQAALPLAVPAQQAALPLGVPDVLVATPPPPSPRLPPGVDVDLPGAFSSSTSDLAFIDRLRLAQSEDEYCGPMLRHLVNPTSVE